MDIISRVDALMRKAEASAYPEESDAFFAKAQELITRHALDEAELGLTDRDKAKLGHETIEFPGAYSYERSRVWAVVGRANRCRVIMAKRYGSHSVEHVTLVGRDDDRRFVRVLAISLETQALRRLPTRSTADLMPGETLTTLRRSFLWGFADELHGRLERSSAAATADHSANASQALLRTESDVDDYIGDMFGGLVADRSSVSINSTSYRSGKAAAAGADVGGDRLPGGRRALGTG